MIENNMNFYKSHEIDKYKTASDLKALIVFICDRIYCILTLIQKVSFRFAIEIKLNNNKNRVNCVMGAI